MNIEGGYIFGKGEGVNNKGVIENDWLFYWMDVKKRFVDVIDLEAEDYNSIWAKLFQILKNFISKTLKRMVSFGALQNIFPHCALVFPFSLHH